MSILTKLYRIFSRETKIKAIILLVSIIWGAMLETLALSIISPFISILMDNSMIVNNPIVNWVYNLLGFKTSSSFLAMLSILLALVYIVRGIYIFLLNKIQYRFIGSRRVLLSDLLLTKILNKSYIFHTKKNIAEMQRVILTDVEYLFSLVNSVLLFCSDAFMAMFVVGYLIIVSPIMTLCVIAIALISIIIYFKFFRQQAKEAGDESRTKYIGMTKAVNQALGGIKEVKVLHREKYFENAFKKNSNGYIIAFQRFQVLNNVPKLFIETFCFGSAFLIIGVLLKIGSNVQEMVPQLSVFVLAAFRLLPAISRLVNYITQIIYYHPSVDAVYTDLFEWAEDEGVMTASEINYTPTNIKGIIVKDVTFQYPNTTDPVLERVSLTIPENKSIAFVGPSGAGKTTLADIILGILIPQEGAVFYNGKSIHQNFENWVQYVGYIPQQIYLLDETILENVAFGIEKDQVNEHKIWHALEQAQLRSFVEDLPDKLYTVVGDRGIRLSGGQRQRIGIARALYNDPPVLVLDEATSSLDTETESAVMDAIQGLQGNKTIIIVAHRLSTIEHCNIVYHIKDRNVICERQ